MTEDLKIIKKLYGEKMMHFCRESFSTILEEIGKLPRILQDNFAPSHNLYNDLINERMIEDFKNYIYDSFHKANDKTKELDIASPEELLKKAKYILYECKTEKDIQAFRKYYAKGEELCTFNGGRLDRCYVFFVVKENVSDIRRENYMYPERQDEYGTSVISIQFSRDSAHTLSIKNRYNHTVNNPDATFSNNLDNIVEGLTYSFEKYYGLKQKYKNNEFYMPGYIRANDGRWYKYNYEINNIYYCADNVIIDNGKVKKYDKEKFIIMDYFVLDLVNKEIHLYEDDIIDSFPIVIGKIKRITISKTGERKKISITNDKDEEITVIINKDGQIVELKSNDIKKIGHEFLKHNYTITSIDLPELKQVGDSFLYSNLSIVTLELPSLQQVGNAFLHRNRRLENLKLPALQQVGDGFLYDNVSLRTLELPQLRQVEIDFLYSNKGLKSLKLPLLQQVGECFMKNNATLVTLELPSLQRVDNQFMSNNTSLVMIDLPELQQVKDSFLLNNKRLEKLTLPKLQSVGFGFLNSNEALTALSLPSLKLAEGCFLAGNKTISELYLPLLKKVGNAFLYNNRALTNLNLPSLQVADYGFLYYNEKLTIVELPHLQEVSENFLSYAYHLDTVKLPELRQAGARFLQYNKVLTTLCLPKLQKAGKGFLRYNETLISFEAPSLQQIGDEFIVDNHLDGIQILEQLRLFEEQEDKKIYESFGLK